jgi:hypothetical protein
MSRHQLTCYINSTFELVVFLQETVDLWQPVAGPGPGYGEGRARCPGCEVSGEIVLPEVPYTFPLNDKEVAMTCIFVLQGSVFWS